MERLIDGGGAAWSVCKDLYFENREDVRSDYSSPLWAKNLREFTPNFRYSRRI